MSHAPASSSAAAPSPAQHHRPSSQHDEAPASSQSLPERRKENRALFNRKRGDLLDDLLQKVDVLIYAELSAVYYMDCSFLRLLLRATVHFFLLSPKPAFFPEPPIHRPYVGAILVANIICLFFHTWNPAPSAGEATRGYLHGGLAMDFIGQLGPTSKLHLVLLDLTVLGLQCIQLTAHILRQRLRPSAATDADSGSHTIPAPSPAQTADDEERGVRHSQDSAGDIELQALSATGHNAAVEPAESPSRDSLLAATDTRIFDAFNSGQIAIADLRILATLAAQWTAYRNHTSTAEEGRRASEGLARNLSASAAGRRILLVMRLLRV